MLCLSICSKVWRIHSLSEVIVGCFPVAGFGIGSPSGVSLALTECICMSIIGSLVIHLTDWFMVDEKKRVWGGKEPISQEHSLIPHLDCLKRYWL
jgi:hypothetical protein